MHGKVDLLHDHVARRFHRGRAGPLCWSAPEEEEVHSYINPLASSFGTYLYERKMYDTRFVLEFAKQW